MATALVGSALLLPASSLPAAGVAPGLNGRLLVLSNPVSSGHWDIVTMDADGTDRVNLTGENQAYVTYNAEASPDGRWIVYQRGGSSQDSIWVMRADGSDKVQLTDGSTADAHPTWSPDGTRIAFVRSQQIWTMDADGTDQALFHADGGWAMGQPEWSPDGTSIAFTRSDQAAGSRIWTKPATGGLATARTTYNDKVSRPSWSPDGSTILFWHDAGNVEGLYTMAPNGSGVALLAAGPLTAFSSYAWSPEGDQIVYTSSTSGNPEVWLMDADGGSPTQVTDEGSAIDHREVSWMVPTEADPTVLPDLTQGQAMAPLQLAGADGATFSLTGGSLPAGLALSPGGVLTGTPTAWGDSVFEVTASGAPTTVVPYTIHVVDPEDPEVNVTSPAPSSATSHSTTISLQHPVRWVGLDATSGVTSYDVRYRRAKWKGSFGGYTLPASWQGITATSLTHPLGRGYTYCYSARATDASGRTGPWGTQRCTIAPLDQTAMQRSSGWKTRNGLGYFDGSTWWTKTRNATLTRTGARLKRLGVLATTCPTCGKIDLFVGSTKVGRINLARGTRTVNRKPILLPAFGLRSGAVRVKVVTKGRLVRIDGLFVGAR
ncbi:MAG: DPP IV N-terminal domain-containing protein [Nocardioides sp.]|nr:DPP IV N-terminal domain-containing protein [Nocardioides sp.]